MPIAPEVTVVGDALLDVQVTPAQPMRSGGDVPARIRLQPGGQGANLAVRLARRGVRVRIVCTTGEDHAGEMVRDALAREGVEVESVAARGERTGVVVVLLEPDRERTMLSDRAPLFAPTVGRGAPVRRDAGWLVVSGYALLEPNFAMPSARGEVRCAVVGCALDPAQVELWMDRLLALAPDLVVVNLDEARTVVGTDAGARELATRLGTAVGAVFVVTHPGGAAAAVAGRIVPVERSPGPVVDTTGAGDAFAATLVAELRDERWPPSTTATESALGAAADVARAVAGVVGAQGRVAGERGA